MVKRSLTEKQQAAVDAIIPQDWSVSWCGGGLQIIDNWGQEANVFRSDKESRSNGAEVLVHHIHQRMDERIVRRIARAVFHESVKP